MNKKYLAIGAGVIAILLVGVGLGSFLSSDKDQDTMTKGDSALSQEKGTDGQAANPPANDPNATYINGIALSAQQKAELKKQYGAEPVAGSYWYDPKSGLTGKVGGQADGKMAAGHQFGTMSATASNGTSGIFINGRQLPQTEVTYYASIIGAIQPGRYFLDAQGGMGVEGGAVLVNLYTTAQQQAAARRTGGGGGDNYWSSGATGSYGNESGGFGYVSGDGFSVTYGN